MIIYLNLYYYYNTIFQEFYLFFKYLSLIKRKLFLIFLVLIFYF